MELISGFCAEEVQSALLRLECGPCFEVAAQLPDGHGGDEDNAPDHEGVCLSAQRCCPGWLLASPPQHRSLECDPCR